MAHAQIGTLYAAKNTFLGFDGTMICTGDVFMIVAHDMSRQIYTIKFHQPAPNQPPLANPTKTIQITEHDFHSWCVPHLVHLNQPASKSYASNRQYIGNEYEVCGSFWGKEFSHRFYPGDTFKILDSNPHADEFLVQIGQFKVISEGFHLFANSNKLSVPITKVPPPMSIGIDPAFDREFNGKFIDPRYPSAKCECGAHSVGSDKHSTWCKLFEKEGA